MPSGNIDHTLNDSYLERYKVEGLSLETSVLTCGDRGGLEGIHVLGGALTIAYNVFDIPAEALRPGSVAGNDKTFKSSSRSTVRQLRSLGLYPGVHSDIQSEGGQAFNQETSEGNVGCAFAQNRQQISKFIADNADDVIRHAKLLRPELFDQPTADDIAKKIVAAHKRFASDDDFFTGGGRAAVQAAVRAGAEVGIVGYRAEKHDHGLIILVAGETINTIRANQDGDPAYTQDSWAFNDIVSRLSQLYTINSLTTSLAELIDTTGTMDLLGVKQIEVIRP